MRAVSDRHRDIAGGMRAASDRHRDMLCCAIPFYATIGYAMLYHSMLRSTILVSSDLVPNIPNSKIAQTWLTMAMSDIPTTIHDTMMMMMMMT